MSFLLDPPLLVGDAGREAGESTVDIHFHLLPLAVRLQIAVGHFILL